MNVTSRKPAIEGTTLSGHTSTPSTGVGSALPQGSPGTLPEDPYDDPNRTPAPVRTRRQVPGAGVVSALQEIAALVDSGLATALHAQQLRNIADAVGPNTVFELRPVAHG